MSFAPRRPHLTPGASGSAGRTRSLRQRYAETDALTAAVGVDDPTRPVGPAEGAGSGPGASAIETGPIGPLPQRVPDLLAGPMSELVYDPVSYDPGTPAAAGPAAAPSAPAPPAAADYSGMFVDPSERSRPEADADRSRLLSRVQAGGGLAAILGGLLGGGVGEGLGAVGLGANQGAGAVAARDAEALALERQGYDRWLDGVTGHNRQVGVRQADAEAGAARDTWQAERAEFEYGRGRADSAGDRAEARTYAEGVKSMDREREGAEESGRTLYADMVSAGRVADAADLYRSLHPTATEAQAAAAVAAARAVYVRDVEAADALTAQRERSNRPRPVAGRAPSQAAGARPAGGPTGTASRTANPPRTTAAPRASAPRAPTATPSLIAARPGRAASALGLDLGVGRGLGPSFDRLLGGADRSAVAREIQDGGPVRDGLDGEAARILALPTAARRGALETALADLDRRPNGDLLVEHLLTALGY